MVLMILLNDFAPGGGEKGGGGDDTSNTIDFFDLIANRS